MKNINKKTLKKTKKRGCSLNSIYFYLTKGCNLRCRHCWIQPKYQTKNHSYPSLDFNLFQRIIEQAKLLGLSRIKLTGGEPFLHPQIHNIIEFAQAQDFHINIETNGVLCTSEITCKLTECKNLFISVSLDGADTQTHEWVRGVEGCFNDAINGIKNLVKAGIRPQIIMTIMRRNKDQIEKLVHLAESLNASSVKFNILQPAARGEKMHKSGEALTIKELIRLGNWIENVLSTKTNLNLYYSHPQAFRSLGKIFGRDRDGCGICGILNILGVLADGSYALCGIGETIPELIFGHAATDKLEDVWNYNPILKKLREGLPNSLEGICSNCIMKSICLGSCIAQNYYRSHSLWAPYWYCAEAEKQELFPETRLIPKTNIK